MFYVYILYHIMYVPAYRRGICIVASMAFPCQCLRTDFVSCPAENDTQIIVWHKLAEIDVCRSFYMADA